MPIVKKSNKSLANQRANVQKVIAAAVATDQALSQAEAAVDSLAAVTAGYSA